MYILIAPKILIKPLEVENLLAWYHWDYKRRVKQMHKGIKALRRELDNLQPTNVVYQPYLDRKLGKVSYELG